MNTSLRFFKGYHPLLQSSTLSFHSKTAFQTHATLIKFGYPTLLTSLLSQHPLLSSYRLHLLSKNVLIHNFMKIGQCKFANHLFDKTPHSDLVTWNSMIGGFVKNARYHQAFQLFRHMLLSNIHPDAFTFASITNACAHLGALTNAIWVHALIIHNKIHINSILTSALIHMYSKCGSIHFANQVFHTLPHSHISVWNAMIKALAIHGLATDALSLFSMMEHQNFQPDVITFLGILTACNHGGLIDQGRKYFDWMTRRYSIQPQMEHYGAMVDLYSRAGLLQEAYSVIKAMPMEPDVVTWRTLLSACRIYRNQELGELAIANMSHLKSGDYVLLSNIYSTFNRWDHAERVRERMKNKGVHKNCGKSWIELAGTIHKFKSGDQSHPEINAILRVLGRLIIRTRSEGYMPVTELVFMDISEEEKEDSLSFHSEKLALAYGILKSCPGAEIRISKNLRICHDCHKWIELVSRVLCRVIIVRDRIRFHQFEGGICSCGDRW